MPPSFEIAVAKELAALDDRVKHLERSRSLEETGLLDELMNWYETEPTGEHWSLLGRTIRVLISRGVHS